MLWMSHRVLSRIFGLGGGEAVRCASAEQSRGVRVHPPPENFEFYIARDVI